MNTKPYSYVTQLWESVTEPFDMGEVMLKIS